jgi:putative sugar O-methyltransferase
MRTERQLSPESIVQNHDLPFVRAWFERTEHTLRKAGFYDKYPLNEFWEKLNIPDMVDILTTSSGDEEVLRRIQETNYFIVSFDSKTTKRAVDLQIDNLRRHHPGILKTLLKIGESSVVPDTLKFERDGQKFTIDIFRIAQIACRVFSLFNLKPRHRHVFFELGAGLGHLCRFILSMTPKSAYVIVDLPISLCFSYLFIRRNFPQKKVLMLESNQVLSPDQLKKYDIIFAAVSVLNSQQAFPVDVFVNTCSLGEMSNESSLTWIPYVQNTLRPKYIYSLNRFLNHIDDTNEYKWRKNENGYSVQTFPEYAVQSFNLEDKFLFGPYFDCLHPRYLELALVSGMAAREDQTKQLASEMLDQFWLRYYESHYWPINYRGSALSHDLTKSGALYAYWENARRHPQALSYLLLLLYMDSMNHDNLMPFEETFYLEEAILRYAGALPAPIRKSAQEYVSLRQERRTKFFGIASAKERNIIISAAAGVMEAMLQHGAAPL